MHQTFHIANSHAMAPSGFGSGEAQDEWGAQILDQIIAIQDRKKFFEENGRQIGHVPGVNTGNGYLESTMPLKLWIALEKKDPEFFIDEKKWERFLAAHPEIRVDLPLNGRSFAT